jgi:hypothetical protein
MRKQSITIEKEREREYFNPSPPRRTNARPGLLRRQSSLDTFDRKPFNRPFEREEYGPPVRREVFREQAFIPAPLPLRRQLGPPPTKRYEREFEEIKVAEPAFYGDDDYRPYPERVREREIIRTRRRSRSRSRTVRSSSTSSESSLAHSVKSEFPKRGKTRMPARLVSKRAIIELGYHFEEEVSVMRIKSMHN